ncbi:MazG-like family protein [Clostridium sp. Cult1]|uniref:MazG-like family protein n=1 Tax=Clostridium sp. Cult1 TaxID=2079002 RepID=UPI001F20CF33|nr:MazG-like family protein [Clostridium sp. Cult1]
MKIAIKSSELMKAFQWLNEKESWELMNSSEAIHVKEELADVMIYCLSLANQFDIDVSTAIGDKI